MEFVVAPETRKKCSSCGGDVGRIIDDEAGKKTYFVVRGAELANLKTGDTKYLLRPFAMHAYVCLKCDHIDFYAFAVMGKPS